MKTHSQSLRNGKWKVFVTTRDMTTFYSVVSSEQALSNGEIISLFETSRDSFREFDPYLEE